MAVSTSITPKPDRSLLMRFYNRARARAAKLDRGRVNRAFGLVLARRVRLTGERVGEADGSKGETYTVTTRSCTCPDHMHRGQTCKHMVALFMLVRMAETLQTGKPGGLAQEAGAGEPGGTLAPASISTDLDTLYGAVAA